MKQILIALTFFVLFVGCKKKDCIDWTYPESESIIISKTDYNKASDVSKKFDFNYFADGCDDSNINELLDMNGDTLKIYGVLTEDYHHGGVRLYNPGEDGSVHISGDIMDTLSLDNQEYYVTGILHLKSFGSDENFKAMISGQKISDLHLVISLYPLSYHNKD